MKAKRTAPSPLTTAAAALGRRGGLAKSEAKARAARENGRKNKGKK